MADLIESMSKNAMLSTVDSLFIETRGLLYEDKFEQLFKAEDILNKLGYHMMLSDNDKIMLGENRSGRVILKIYDEDGRFINRQMIYFWTYNTQTAKYNLFGQLQ
jgi:hypothetical protein